MPVEPRRYQVFVSSTYLDLQEERHAVIMALLQLDAFPSGMELFPAADEDAWSLIRGVIEDCDYYLLVIGGRYGSVDPVDEISYTEKEFDYAVSQGKPVMAFLHGDTEAIPVGKAEKSEIAQQKLTAFREKVKTHKHVKHWTSPEDLAGKVALTFGQFVRTYPAVGWVRADQQTSTEALAEINDLRKELAAARSSLDAARTTPPAGSDVFAQGGDTFETWLDYSVTLRVEGQIPRAHRDLVEITPTWDQLFAAVAPMMLDEASEKALEEQLDDWAQQEFYADAIENLRASLKRDGVSWSKTRRSDYRASMTHDDFHTILVQLVALGLIMKSDRRRSVRDAGTYWSLTPYGHTRLIQLRAIRRDGTSALSTAEGPPEDSDI
jgi:hypothetical protein